MSIINYLKEVKAEMVHVSWPTKKQTSLFTAVVILLSFAVALYLGLLDYVLRIGVTEILN